MVVWTGVQGLWFHLTSAGRHRYETPTCDSTTGSSDRSLALSFKGDELKPRKEPMLRSDPINLFRRDGLSLDGDICCASGHMDDA